MKRLKVRYAGWSVAMMLAVALVSVSCESGDSDSGGVLAGKWVGFTITATNGISVTRDLTMKLKHNAANNVTGTTKTGNEDAQPLVGTFFPASSVMEISISTSGGTIDQTWRLEDGGTALTQVSGGSGQVFRE